MGNIDLNARARQVPSFLLFLCVDTIAGIEERATLVAHNWVALPTSTGSAAIATRDGSPSLSYPAAAGLPFRLRSLAGHAACRSRLSGLRNLISPQLMRLQCASRVV